MTIYMLYLAVVILVGWYLLGDKITAKQKTNCIMGLGLFLVLMMSLRYMIGYDYTSYLRIFNDLKGEGGAAGMTVSQIVAQYKLESGFFLFFKALIAMGLGYQQFIFVCSVIMVCCVMYTIYRHSPVWWLSAALYMMLQFVPYSMNLLRQAIAASIIFAAWGLLKKGRWWQFMLVVLLASTIHMSALIMIPAYFLMRVPYKPLTWGVYGAGAITAYLAVTPIIKLVGKLIPKYAGYAESSIYGQSNGFNYVVYIPMLFCIAALLMGKQLIKRDSSNSILIFASFFAAFFSLMYTRMYILERFAVYFFIFSLILLPEMVAVFKDQYNALSDKEKLSMKKKQQIPEYTLAAAAILCVAMFYMGCSARDGAHKAYPYVGIWEQQNAMDNDTYFSKHS